MLLRNPDLKEEAHVYTQTRQAIRTAMITAMITAIITKATTNDDGDESRRRRTTTMKAKTGTQARKIFKTSA